MIHAFFSKQSGRHANGMSTLTSLGSSRLGSNLRIITRTKKKRMACAYNDLMHFNHRLHIAFKFHWDNLLASLIGEIRLFSEYLLENFAKSTGLAKPQERFNLLTPMDW